MRVSSQLKKSGKSLAVSTPVPAALSQLTESWTVPLRIARHRSPAPVSTPINDELVAACHFVPPQIICNTALQRNGRKDPICEAGHQSIESHERARTYSRGSWTSGRRFNHHSIYPLREAVALARGCRSACGCIETSDDNAGKPKACVVAP